MRLNLAVLDKLPPDERRAAEKLLEGYEKAHKANPLFAAERDLHKHPKQAKWLASHLPIKLLLGGNRSGKSTGGVIDDVIQCIDPDAVPEGLLHIKKWQPPFFCRVVTKDFKNTHQVVVDKFKEWTPKEQLRGGRWSGSTNCAYDKQDRRLWFRNGSWVEFMSQEQDLDAFGARDLHRVHFDEEPLYEHGLKMFNECQMRLIDHGGDTLLTLTPQNGMSWLYDKLYQPWEKGEAPDVFAMVVSIHDNPHLSGEGKRRILEQLSKMSPEEREARENGLFVSFEGLVYPRFSKLDEGGHVIPQWSALPEPEERGRIVIGIDPGIRADDNHGCGVVWVHQARDGSVTQFDDMKLTDDNAYVAEIARQIMFRNAEWGLPKPDWYVIDPSARNRSLVDGKKVQSEFAKFGIHAMPGQNDQQTGISKVRTLLAPVVDPDGTEVAPARFRVTANCQATIEEFGRYRWTAPKRSEHAPKDTPVKRHDDCLDALRYVVMSLPDVSPPPAPDNRSYRERLLADDIAHVIEQSQRGDSSEFGPGYFD